MLSNLIILSYCSKLRNMWGQSILECKNNYDILYVRMVDEFWWVVGLIFVIESNDDGLGGICL